MRKLFTLAVVLFLLMSVSGLAFVSDFEGEGDTVVMYSRWTGVVFPYVDGWYGRVGINDSLPIEVFNAQGSATAFEGEHSLGVILWDTATTDPGSDKWDFNSRPGEGGVNHFYYIDGTDTINDVVLGDTISFNVWIPPEGEIDSSLLIRSYAQYLDWGVFDVTDSISVDSLYTLGFAGAWKEFIVVLPDTVSGSDVFAVGMEFDFPEVVNPGDTIYVDYILNKLGGSGVPVPEGANVLTLPATSLNSLKYEISAALPIHIDVYNISGQRVKEIVPGTQAAGAYSVNVDLAPGVYLYKVVAEKQSKSTKLIVLE